MTIECRLVIPVFFTLPRKAVGAKSVCVAVLFLQATIPITEWPLFCSERAIFPTATALAFVFTKAYLNRRTKGGVILSEAKDLFLR